jgi:transcriptional regulator with XRE-family HTH domain
MNLADELKALRGEMSLRRLAKELEIDHSFLSRIESGELPSASEEFLDRLAACFNLPEERQIALYLAAGKSPPELHFFFQKDPKRALTALCAAFADDLEAHRREIVRRLAAIGFSEAAATTYVRILRAGYLPEDRLQDVPREVLRELFLRRLIFYERQDSGCAYFALDPATAFGVFWNETLWQKAVTEEELVKLPPEEEARLREVQALCRELAEMASLLHTRRHPVAADNIRIAQGVEELGLALEETIAQAQKEIVALSRSPRLPQVALVWKSLSARLEAGAVYRRICDLDEVVEHGLHIKRRDMEMGVQLRVLEAEDISRKFYLVDGRYCVIYLPDELGEGFALTGQVVDNPWLARRYQQDFEAVWKKGIPAEMVVNILEETTPDLLRQAEQILGPQGREWLRKVIDWGIFARFPDMMEEDRRRIEDESLAAGLVERRELVGGALVPRYPLAMVEIRRLYAARRVGESVSRRVRGRRVSESAGR